MNLKHLTQAYPLKLPQDTSLRTQVEWLRALVTRASQQLLADLWSEQWIDALATTTQRKKKKAYKVINEKRVSLTSSTGDTIYLPSRIRRCIAE